MTVYYFKKSGKILPKGVTFFKDFSINNVLDADISLGNTNSLFTATRGSSNPATYIDSNGVIQKTEVSDDPRFTTGYYDETGFHSIRRGLLIEGESTNYLKHTIFDTDSDADGLADEWGVFNTSSSSFENELVDISDICGISGSQGQRIKLVADVSDSGESFLITQSSQAGTFSEGDYATASFWIKGSYTGNFNTNCIIKIKDSGGSNLAQVTLDISGYLDNTWRRVSLNSSSLPVNTDHLQLQIIAASGFDSGESFDAVYANVQLEKNKFSTSFIPTTSGTLTRNKEILKYEISNNRTKSNESFFCSLMPGFTQSMVRDRVLTDTDNKRRAVYFDNGVGDLSIYPNLSDSPGSGFITTISSSWSAFDNLNVGYSVQNSGDPNVEAYNDGSSSGTDNTDFIDPDWGTYFYIGCNSSGNQQIDSIIHSIGFFDNFLESPRHRKMFDFLK